MFDQLPCDLLMPAWYAREGTEVPALKVRDYF